MVYAVARRPVNNVEVVSPAALANLERAKGQQINFEVTSLSGLGLLMRGVSWTYTGKLVGVEEGYLCVDMEGSQIKMLTGYADGDTTIVRHFWHLFGDCDVVNNIIAGQYKIYERKSAITTEKNMELKSLERAA